MTTQTGVAISTTGDEHRLPGLAQSVANWSQYLDTVVVTVDGDERALWRARMAVRDGRIPVYRVGQPGPGWEQALGVRNGRLGVAANKNTGIELLMNAGVDHLFLADDDVYPLRAESLDLHIEHPLEHSIVCWGPHRLIHQYSDWAEWTWPRGVVLYVERVIVDEIGGMDERFGPGGHEHVEWSRRIFQADFTIAPYPSPLQYSTHNAYGARNYWAAEDMRKSGEPIGNMRARKRKNTTITHEPGDWEYIEQVMKYRDGNPEFVPYSARENRRLSATLYHN